MNPIGIITHVWKRSPLANRMVALLTCLLTLGLALSGSVMIGLLERHLTAQVDEELALSAKSLGTTRSIMNTQDATGTKATNEPVVPTRFFIRQELPDSPASYQYSPDTIEKSGYPLIPHFLRVGEYASTANGWTRPVTVNSNIKGMTWRSITLPLVSSIDSKPVGIITIALPLTDIRHTLRDTAIYFFVTSIIIVACGASLGKFLVTRSLTPLRDIEKVAHRIASGDFTQRVRSAPQTTEVGSLAVALNTMLTRVEHSFIAQQESEKKTHRFISDASHELRTPLSVIIGFSELFKMGGIPSSETGDAIDRILSEAKRLTVLVEDMLSLARLDEGRPMNMLPLDLAEMAEIAAFDLQALAPGRPISVASMLSNSPTRSLVVQADRDEIQQVFTNIIGNIDRYTDKNTPVEIVLGEKDNFAVIEFRDHGPGIPQNEIAHAFERFTRAEGSRSRSLGGSGLGLAIVSGILKAHGGHATLTQTTGGGLTVIIQLPISEQE